MAGCIKRVAKEVLGESRGRVQPSKETWWWNDECAKVVEEKKKLFEVMKKSETGVDRSKAEMDKKAYEQIKRKAKDVIGQAKQSECTKCCESLEAKHGKGEVFKVVKQMVKRNKDVTGAGCIRNARGNVVK